jgi:hypothetical protein
MAIVSKGSNVVVDAPVAGSVFPTEERELVFPVLVDGTKEPVVIEGSLYGRSVELRGNVWIKGPVVSRGDTTLNSAKGCLQLDSGLTVNGSVSCVTTSNGIEAPGFDSVQDAGVIIKGDLAVNQNIHLRNAVVFGSIRAVNCVLRNCVVLGTCIVDETLNVSMSSIGGYASRDVTFEGSCLMLHALGESLSQPLFVPFEGGDGVIVGCDVRYYPAIRAGKSILNRSHAEAAGYPEYSKLFPATDWVRAETNANPALDEQGEGRMTKWVLSIGGRVCDISKISTSITLLSQMLKCGFEYEHYNPSRRGEYLERALRGLTDDESWILKSVCH